MEENRCFLRNLRWEVTEQQLRVFFWLADYKSADCQEAVLWKPKSDQCFYHFG